MFILYVGIILLLIYFIYQQITKPFDYWKKRNVKYIPPWPLIGNVKLIRNYSFTEMTQKWYNDYPNERYVGTFQFLLPALLIRDAELVKRISIKDFDSFMEHRILVQEDIDPLWNKNLFQMSAEKWREMRPTLSPAFTSSKMRKMFILMEEVSNQTIDFVKKQEQKLYVTEMKDFFSRYTTDVVATCAFGLKCDSLKNQSNEFFKMGKKVTEFKGLRIMTVFLNTISPYLAKIFRMKFVLDEVANFFSPIIQQSLKARRENGIVREDMLDLLLEAQKGRLNYKENKESGGFQKSSKRSEITDYDILAQAIIFFIAGFHTASSLMTFASYEIAINPDIQEKLHKEIEETWEKCNRKLTYDHLLKMKYFDSVISESLRKWPPFVLNDRIATRDFVIEPENENESPLLLEKGTVCALPIFAIQRDPKYYPNPEKFDPERFSEENKHNFNTSAYLPFGLGPRNCIGSRFALLETKILLFHLLKSFEILPTEKTQIPLKLDVYDVNPMPTGGMWLGFKSRISN